LVADMKYSDVKSVIPPQVYLPYKQDGQTGQLSFYVRTTAAPEAAMNTVRQVIDTLDPNLPLVGLRTMNQQVRSNVSADRVFSTLSASFALLATLLASVGVYGVLAYTVSQRTREFGLRMALGAAPGNVQRLVLRQVAWMTGIGAVVGIALAIGIGTLMATLLFNVTGHDPVVIGLSLSALSLIALAAGLIPAMRASRIDPMKALRYE
jgi:ABC-type antimicrobial peptide transport system permease subunit